MSDSRHSEVVATFGGAVMRVVMDQIKTLPEVWQKLPEEQQQGLIDIAREEVEKVVRQCVANAVAFGYPHTTVGVESLNGKESGIKVTLSIREPAVIHDLADALGGKCVLVLVDPEMFAAGADAFKAEADQSQLPLGEPEGEELETA